MPPNFASFRAADRLKYIRGATESMALDIAEWIDPECRLAQMERNVKRSLDAGKFRGFGRLVRVPSFGGGVVWRTLRHGETISTALGQKGGST